MAIFFNFVVLIYFFLQSVYDSVSQKVYHSKKQRLFMSTIFSCPPGSNIQNAIGTVRDHVIVELCLVVWGGLLFGSSPFHLRMGNLQKHHPHVHTILYVNPCLVNTHFIDGFFLAAIYYNFFNI